VGQSCLNSTSWREEGSKYPGSQHETTTKQRLQRLDNFLEEVEEKGSWDQHIAPMTYLIATKNKHSDCSSYFDIAHVINLTNIIAQSAGKEVKMVMTGHSNEGISGSGTPIQPIARSAVTMSCHLYQHDEV